jgi:hypothetical protein
MAGLRKVRGLRVDVGKPRNRKKSLGGLASTTRISLIKKEKKYYTRRVEI